ncbi:MAG: hypothetical protein PHE15_01110 [Dehalococcoidales bacterium]|nr:hypothetical protein [Dehalococcoidales bacterium]
MPEKINKSNIEKARAAENKVAALGKDLELAKYISQETEKPSNIDPSRLCVTDKEKMLSTGVMIDNPSQRTGTYIQIDNTPVHYSTKQEGVEVMAISQAKEKYDWFGDYWW